MADMVSVSSDAVSAIGYSNGTLYIQWKTGKTYKHPGVPASVYEALMAAPSIGQFIAKHIRTQYPGTPA